jgi:hypothetical protein
MRAVITLMPASFWKAAAGLFAVGAVAFAALAVFLHPRAGGPPVPLAAGQRQDLPDIGLGTQVVIYGKVPPGEERVDVGDALDCRGFNSIGLEVLMMTFDSPTPDPRTIEGAELQPLVFPNRRVAAVECAGAGTAAAAPLYLVSLPDKDLYTVQFLFGFLSVMALAMTGVAFAFAKVVQARRTPGPAWPPTTS